MSALGSLGDQTTLFLQRSQEEARTRRFLERLSRDPEGAARLARAISAWGDQAPTLPAGAIVGLAHGDITPDHPVGKQIITHGVPGLRAAPIRGLLGPDMPGPTGVSEDPWNPPAHANDPSGLGWVGDIGRAVGGVGRAVGGAVADVAGAVDRNVLDPIDRTFARGESAATGGRLTERDVAASVPGPEQAKAASRVAFAGANDALRVIETPLNLTAKGVMSLRGVDSVRTPFGGQLDVGSWSDLLDPGQLQLVQAASGKSLGHGILPGGEAHDAAVRDQQQAAAINGSALTYGRALASGVSEPGSRLYSIMSGTVDATVATVLDPSNAVLKAWTRSAQLAKQFAPVTDDAIANTARFLADSTDQAGIVKLRAWAGANAGDDTIEAVSAKIAADHGGALEIANELGKKPADLLRAMKAPQVGIAHGLRPILKRESALTHLNSEEGRKLVDRIAGERSFTKLRAMFDDTVPVDFIYGLAHASDPAEVRALYQAELGASVAGPPRWFRPPAAHIRLFDQMPNGAIDTHNANQMVDQAEKILSLVKFPRDRWDEVLEPLANPLLDSAAASDAWLHGVGDAARDWIVGIDANAINKIANTRSWDEITAALGTKLPDAQMHLLVGAKSEAGVRRVLAGIGFGKVPYDLATKLTRSFRHDYIEQSKFFTDQLGETPRVAGWVNGGEPVVLEGPFATTELLNRMIPAPDYRALRQATTKWRQITKLYNDGHLVQVPEMHGMASGSVRARAWAADVEAHVSTALTKAFKTLILAAPRTGLVILADEQTRMAASGLDSAWSPMSYIAWVVGKKGGAFEKLPGAGTRGTTDALGTTWVEQLGDETSAMTAAIGRSSSVARGELEQQLIKHQVMFGRDQTQYLDAWAGNLGKLHLDGPTREVARAIIDPTHVPKGVSGGGEIPLSRFFSGDSLNDAGRALFGNDEAAIERIHGLMDEMIAARLGGAIRGSDELAPDAAGAVFRNAERDIAGTVHETSDVLRAEYDVLHGRMMSELRAAGAEPAGLAGTDAVKEWFFTGAGQKFRKDLRDANLRWGSAQLDDRAVSDWYIDQLRMRVHEMTGGDDQLIDAVAHGTPFDFTKVHKGVQHSVDADFRRYLAQQADAVGPVQVPGQAVTSAARKNYIERGSQMWFGLLMDTPARVLSRSPVFAQSYWADVERMLPRLTKEAQADAIAQAAKVRITISPVAATGDLTLETVDMYAKARALATTKSMLDYPGEKSSIEDIMRNVAPFATAWRDALAAWTKLAKANPNIVRRGQQIIQGAQQSGFMANEPGLDGGNYFTVFGMDPTRWATGATGFELQGETAGLNIVARGLPGVGFGVQIAAGALIPKTSATEAIHKFISPYGEPDISGGLLESFAPGFADKLRASGVLQRNGVGYGPTDSDKVTIENLAMDAFKTMAATGKYDLTDRSVLARMAEKSRDQAQHLMLLRAIGSAFVPTALRYNSKAKVKDGQLIELFLLGEDYRKKLEELKGDSAAATRWFVDKYGPEVAYATQPKSRSVVYGLPTDVAGTVWKEAHQTFAAAYPGLVGFWVPQPVAGDRGSIELYYKQIKSGEREALTVEQWTLLANDRLGNAVYDQIRRRLPVSLNAAQREALAAVKVKIHEQYPGFTETVTGISTRQKLPEQIELLLGVGDKPGALDAPDVKHTPLASAARDYLKIRQAVLDKMERKSLTGEKMAQARDLLYGVGTQIATANPSFVAMWNNLFQYEVEPTEEGAPGG